MKRMTACLLVLACLSADAAAGEDRTDVIRKELVTDWMGSRTSRNDLDTHGVG